jgi:5-methylcytosine-specific restriction endonuclease McrA
MPKYDDWSLDVSDLKTKRENSEIIPDAEWQRGYIWDVEDEKLLIDSILLGLPIPKFFLTKEWNAEKQKSIHYVVDGQQRIGAIYRFLTNEYSIKLDGKEYKFKDLKTDVQQKISNYKLTGHYMTEYKQEDITFLFKRLNSTGVKLTSIEIKNAEYSGTNLITTVKKIYETILGFPSKKDYRDYDEKDFEKLRKSYYACLYTEDNIKRMVPLEDIADLCNCLTKKSIQGGAKKEIDEFWKTKKDISDKDSANLISKFGKVNKHIHNIFTKDDLNSSGFSKRTHFFSLFLTISQLIQEYYIDSEKQELKDKLLDFINEPTEEYFNATQGAIRQKQARETRATELMQIFQPYTKELDKKRLFDEDLRKKLYRKSHTCGICKKDIKHFPTEAVVDHIIPWAKGGKTIESNAQIAHAKCNASKSSKYEALVIRD